MHSCPDIADAISAGIDWTCLYGIDTATMDETRVRLKICRAAGLSPKCWGPDVHMLFHMLLIPVGSADRGLAVRWVFLFARQSFCVGKATFGPVCYTTWHSHVPGPTPADVFTMRRCYHRTSSPLAGPVTRSLAVESGGRTILFCVASTLAGPVTNGHGRPSTKSLQLQLRLVVPQRRAAVQAVVSVFASSAESSGHTTCSLSLAERSVHAEQHY